MTQYFRGSELFSDTESQRLAEEISRNAGRDERLSADLAQAVEAEVKNDQTSQLARTLGVTHDQGFQRSREGAVSANRSIREVAALRDALGSQFSQDAPLFAKQVLATGGYGPLWEMAQGAGINLGDVQDDAGRWHRAGLFDSYDAALAYTLGQRLMNQGDMLVAREFTTFLADRFGTRAAAFPDADANQDLFAAAGDPDAALAAHRDAVDGQVGPVGSPAANRDALLDMHADAKANHGPWLAMQRELQALTGAYLTAQRAGDSEEMATIQGQIADLGERAQVQFGAAATIGEFVFAGRDAQHAAHAANVRAAEGEAAADKVSEWDRRHEDQRGPLQVVGEFGFWEKMREATDIDAASWSGALAGFQDAHETALAAGRGPAAAFIEGIGGALSGGSAGRQAGLERLYNERFDEAREWALPESAAHYYAARATLWHERVQDAVPRMLGFDEAFNQLADETRTIIGDKGLAALERAAQDDSRNRMVDLMEAGDRARDYELNRELPAHLSQSK